jgi:hypothetical protein
MNELRKRESAVSRLLRAASRLGLGDSDAGSVASPQAARARSLVRGVVTCRYAAASTPIRFETLKSRGHQGPEAKTAAAAAT